MNPLDICILNNDKKLITELFFVILEKAKEKRKSPAITANLSEYFSLSEVKFLLVF